MTTTQHFPLFVAVLSSLTIHAQPPVFDFRQVIRPGMTIGGHIFTTETTIDSPALNDAGEVAFIAHWPDKSDTIPEERPGEQTSVFTSRRIVASNGDMIDGKFILEFTKDSVAINATGQVAYSALYTDRVEDAETGPTKLGVFVDKHLALTQSAAHKGYILGDDGEVTPKASQAPLSSDPPARKNSSILEHIHIKPPNGLPITIAPSRNRPIPEVQRGTKPNAVELPPLFPMNHSGQIVIPVNLKGSGFFLLLGTPTH